MLLNRATNRTASPTSTTGLTPSPKTTRTPLEIPVQKSLFKTADGTKLYFERRGKISSKKKAPALVFCYGLICSHRLWEPQLDYFSKQYPVIWMDYRGHHQSERPRRPETLTLYHFAQDLKGLLDHLGEREVILVGHSLGSSVALEFYHQFSNRVKGLILANGAIRRPLETLFSSNRLERSIQFLLRAYQRSPKLFARIFSLQLSAPVFSQITRDIIRRKGFNISLNSRKDLEAILRAFAQIHPEVLVRLLLDFQDRDDSTWVHEIDVPTLIIAGAKDSIVPPSQQLELHQLVSKSEFEIFSHGHHCPQIDVSQAFNLRLDLFLKTHFNHSLS